MDRMRVYDILYALAARGGREQALFGNYGPAAREAYQRSLVEQGFPELWFEIPLAGEPWLDFHALIAYADVAGTQAVFAGHDGVYAEALTWFAAQEPKTVRQLALSYDTSAGDVGHPAVQLLVNGRGLAVPLGFLEAAGRPDLCASFETFVRALPPEWYACYVGIFPGRKAASTEPWVRVECIVGDEAQRAYAADAEALREHLARVGLASVDPEYLAFVQELARSPFPLELQFNVGQAGTALPALSASVRFAPEDWSNAASLAEIGCLARWMQAQGLADERCALLAQTVFAQRIEREGEAVSVSCFPAFVKLRWRAGLPADAKSYLMLRFE